MYSLTTTIAAFALGTSLLYSATQLMIRRPVAALPGGPYAQEIVSVFTALFGAILTVFPLINALIWVSEPYGLLTMFYVTVIPSTLVAFVLILMLDGHIRQQRWNRTTA